MKVIIKPSQLSGTITAPPSKSMTHRALICAALADGTTILTNILRCDDTDVTIAGLHAFGVAIEELSAQTMRVTGTGGKLIAPKRPIIVGNSGTTARFMLALAALTKGKITLQGTARLHQRPFTDLIEALRAQSVSISHTPRVWYVDTSGLNQLLPGGTIKISAKASSQFISALLFIVPFAGQDTHIQITNLTSTPYMELTIDMLRQFGIRTTVEKKSDTVITITIPANQKYSAVSKLTIEGDWSAVSYFYAANKLGANIQIDGLNNDSKQADRAIVEILQHIPGTIDMNNTPDIVPTVAVVAAFQNGTTVIKNIEHLRGKESDRIEALVVNLTAMGIKTSVTADSLTVVGGNPHGAVIKTFDDHRIAMSFAIAGLFAQGQTTIKHAEVINKSYPNFWNDLQHFGAAISCTH